MHWQELWERYSAEESARMEAVPLGDLLEEIRSGSFGRYYSIWRVVAGRAALEEAGWTLFSVLESDADYLHRYHCAAALLELMGLPGLRPVDLSGNHGEVPGNIETVRNELESRIGSPGPAACQP